MMNYYLGDEQAPAPLFVRLVAPTDLDQTVKRMIDVIKDYYSGVDLLNLGLWRKLGWEGGPVVDFLQRYFIIARTRKEAVNEANMASFVADYLSRYPGSREDDTVDYFQALVDLAKAGMVPDTIYRPWTYEPQTLAEEIGGVVQKSVVPTIILFGVLAIAAYGVSTTILPQLAKAKGSRS